MASLLEKELSSFAFKEIRNNRIRYFRPDQTNFVPGMANDFKWKDYCPDVFRRMREFKMVDLEDYKMSISADEILREVCVLAKPGKVIPLLTDDRYVIRIMSKSEVKVILDMLPQYYLHIRQHPASLLSRMYGLHAVRPAGGIKVYFAVTSNIIPAAVNVYRIYELKASSKRRTDDNMTVEDKIILKDLDLEFCFYLEPSIRKNLLLQIKNDCQYLETAGVMDYRLMIGMATESPHHVPNHCGNSDGWNKFPSTSPRGSLDGTDSRSSNTISDYPLLPSVSIGSRISGCDKRTDYSLQEFEETEAETVFDEDIIPDPNSAGLELGFETPARAVRVKAGRKTHNGRREPASFDAVLYFAIVDIFQRYTMTKRIEHACKSIQYNSNSISSVNPRVYSSRFQDFLSQNFQAEEMDSTS